MTLVLASASPTRRRLLAEAGIEAESRPAPIDERAAEAPLLSAGATPRDIAAALASAKALAVSEIAPGALVIGADQTLDVDGERMTKPADMHAARGQLKRLSGRSHQLHSAVACARDGEILWQDVESVTLTMRDLTPADIDRYLSSVGDDALASVGAYQIEGRGIQLFERIDGDFFAILGLPLLTLMAFLRAQKVLA
jgi:septum formation protein